MKCVFILVVLAVAIPWEATGSYHGMVFGRCRFGRQRPDDKDVGKHGYNRLDWKNEKVWRHLIPKWNHWKKENCERELPGPCDDGKKNYKCAVCYGESSEADCIKNSVEEECKRGQNACVLQNYGGKYFRRCGHKCECKNNPALSCTNAGCKDVYECAAVGCDNSTDRYSYNKNGDKCRCDVNCHRDMKCCDNVCMAGHCPNFMGCMMGPLLDR